ncbi:anti-sigma factor antagonist [Bacillus sp. 03113]|uniref:anti-sigma factor antagonist n=1 Tax=Bacillus sp. 03113 TaxID=2578211 RepID=UPI001144D812|nr:anti-sigma factor antagonist [Bacillus sp. 03113]
MNMAIEVKEQDLLVEVKVIGEIDAYTAPILRDRIFPLSEKNNVVMIVDLSKVSYLDSTGLGIFIGIFKNIRSQNGEFKIMGLSERLKRLFDITGLADVFDITSKIEGGIR